MPQVCLVNTYDFTLKTNLRPLGPHQQEEVYEICISPQKSYVLCYLPRMNPYGIIYKEITPEGSF